MNTVLKRISILFFLLGLSLIAEDTFIGVDKYGEELHLTLEEREFLDGLSSVKMCVDPNWMPYESIDSEGNYVGIISDYMKLLSQRLNIPFVLVPTKNYKESRSFLTEDKCHIIPADVATDEVKEMFLSTRPYFFSPRVFALHKNHPRVLSFEEIAKERIGVQSQSPAAFLLKKEYPGINITPFEDTDAGLRELEAGGIDAFVTIIGSISHSIVKQGLSSVKIGGEVLNEIPLSLLINKNYPLLVSSLDKAIQTISPRDRIAISERWIVIKHEGIKDYGPLRRILLGVAVLFILASYHIVSIRRLNTLLAEKNRELKDISRTDPLTGIMNRRALVSIIESDIHRNLRSGQTSCLILFDIDHFKHINDSYGHDMGDKALIAICKSVQVKIRNIDFFARWGGEEFLILASGTSLYNAGHLGEKIRKTVEDLEYENGMKTTVSVGIAEFTNNEVMEDWFKRVDEALYKAKEAGRNNVKMDNFLSEPGGSIQNPFSQVSWRPEYSSGNIIIDSEHRELFTRVTGLINRVLADESDMTILQDLEQIIKDTSAHFEHEEDVLKKTDYPLCREHMEVHTQLIHKAENILGLYMKGHVNMTAVLSYFIFDLIAKHVLEYDVGYFKYLNKRRG